MDIGATAPMLSMSTARSLGVRIRSMRDRSGFFEVLAASLAYLLCRAAACVCQTSQTEAADRVVPELQPASVTAVTASGSATKTLARISRLRLLLNSCPPPTRARHPSPERRREDNDNVACPDAAKGFC